MRRWDLINALLRRNDGTRYLEIGTGDGKTASRVLASQRWGVDPSPEANTTPYTAFHFSTSDDFFRKLPTDVLFDVIFIDGLHHARQVYRDVLNALGHIVPFDGYIVLHDCNPQTEAAQRVPRTQSEWNGDCWKAVVKLRAEHPMVDVFVVDADHGLGVVREAVFPSGLDLHGADPYALTWNDLVKRREELLGLVPVTEWEKRLP